MVSSPDCALKVILWENVPSKIKKIMRDAVVFEVKSPTPALQGNFLRIFIWNPGCMAAIPSRSFPPPWPRSVLKVRRFTNQSLEMVYLFFKIRILSLWEHPAPLCQCPVIFKAYLSSIPGRGMDSLTSRFGIQDLINQKTDFLSLLHMGDHGFKNAAAIVWSEDLFRCPFWMRHHQKDGIVFIQDSGDVFHGSVEIYLRSGDPLPVAEPERDLVIVIQFFQGGRGCHITPFFVGDWDADHLSFLVR